MAELDAALAAARGQPVLLDFYADWCVSCIEMEDTTFRDPAVQQAMAKVVLLKADVTANLPAHQALLQRFGLYGPPGMIFFDRHGKEQQRLIGYSPADEFLPLLQRQQSGG
ncbi:Thiol:disulfide interchange protein DsbD precursor [compost metagenome]